MEKLVIALGGNALQEGNGPATAEAQLAVVERTSVYIADIIEKGYQVILAHGNGPQVGRIVLQNENSVNVTPAMPFDVCGAMSQGMIGYHMQQGLTKALRARGNWMQSGCYTVMPGPAVVVRWKDIGDMERIEMRDIEKTYAFKGWPTPDLTKAAARHQATVGGK